MAVSIEDLPHTVLEHIFLFLRPYKSLNNARQVNSYWYRTVDDLIRYMKRRYYLCQGLNWYQIKEKLYDDVDYISERGGHASCYSKADNAMYMFGGCTSRYSPLSDMWKLDLESLEWKRVEQRGDIPSARSLSSLLDCGDVLVLYGGYANSSMNPINQRVHFFGDLFYFVKSEQRWIQIGTDGSDAPCLASHGASILNNRWMVIFGGSSGEDFSGEVFAFDLLQRTWAVVDCTGEPPSPRHGHCQVVIDELNVLIIGGAGVIRGVYSDVFLLTFDPQMSSAKWTSIRIHNRNSWPPHFWGIRGCRLEDKVIFLSRPHCSQNGLNGYRRPTLNTVTSVTSSSSSGLSRLSSPDSPQDRRAVAAAFSQRNGLTESAALRRKSQFLASKSLDDQKDDKLNRSAYNGYLSVSPQQIPSPTHMKSAELQRACSIPAIIVGEIPKLIITDDLCSPKPGIRNSTLTDNERPNNGFNHEESNICSKTCHNFHNGDLYQRMCVFALDIAGILSTHEASWHEHPVQSNAPSMLMLYSLVEANGELVVFGGMKDPSESNPFLHVNSPNEPGYATNCTYLLKPNYFQL